MNTIKSFIGWIKPRWLRLAIGVLILTIAVQEQDYFIGFIASVLLFQAVMNQYGCGCGAIRCEVPQQKKP